MFIATLSTQASKAGMHCVISTGDKDLAQLVDERVTLVNTMTNEKLDIEGVKQKFGVPPELIVDYYSLVGDAVDNVPGVDKVGPKTAAKWIAQYGSLDGVVAHAGEMGGAVGENLRKALDWLPKARWLLTMRRDCELPVTLEDLHKDGYDAPRLRELFARYGFKTWLREVEGGSPAPEETQPKRDFRTPVVAPPAPASCEDAPRRKYSMLITEPELRELAARLETAAVVGFDTETDGLEPMVAHLVGLSFAFDDVAYYVPVAHRYAGAPDQLGVERALGILRPWLESDKPTKVGQNLKFDAHILANHGVALRGIAHDTLLESYVLEVHERHDLRRSRAATAAGTRSATTR